jgi:orotate phosphoribosyltransferase
MLKRECISGFLAIIAGRSTDYFCNMDGVTKNQSIHQLIEEIKV